MIKIVYITLVILQYGGSRENNLTKLWPVQPLNKLNKTWALMQDPLYSEVMSYKKSQMDELR